MAAASGTTTEIKCPSCGATYHLTQWGLLKMLRRPKCQRCGASLMELLRSRLQPRLPGSVSGQISCPRCGRQQEPAPYCKWCGNNMEALATAPAPGKVQPGMGLPWFRILSTGLVLLFLVLMPVLQEMQVPQAYQASRTFLLEEARLARLLGGELRWGPVPFFFWKSSRGSAEVTRGSFFFLAKGPKATVVVVVVLEKPSQSGGRWQVVDGSYILGTDGKKTPLPPPFKANSSGKT